MKLIQLTIILSFFGLFLISCGKKAEKSISTFNFTGDYKAGEVLKMSMIQESEFTLSNNTPIAFDANDFVEGDILKEDINNYIGETLGRDVKRNEALKKNMFIKPN